MVSNGFNGRFVWYDGKSISKLKESQRIDNRIAGKQRIVAHYFRSIVFEEYFTAKMASSGTGSEVGPWLTPRTWN